MNILTSCCMVASLATSFITYQFIDEELLCIICRSEESYSYYFYCTQRHKVVGTYDTDYISHIVEGSHENVIVHADGRVIASSSGTQITVPDDFMKFSRGQGVGIDDILFVYNDRIYERASNAIKDVDAEVTSYYINVWQTLGEELWRAHSRKYNRIWPWATTVINITSRYHISFESRHSFDSNTKQLVDYFYLRTVCTDSFIEADCATTQGRFLSAFAVSPSQAFVLYDLDGSIRLRRVLIDVNGEITLERELWSLEKPKRGSYYVFRDYLVRVVEHDGRVFEISYLDIDNPSNSLTTATYELSQIPKINVDGTTLALLKESPEVGSTLLLLEFKNNALEEVNTIPLLVLRHGEILGRTTE